MHLFAVRRSSFVSPLSRQSPVARCTSLFCSLLSALFYSCWPFWLLLFTSLFAFIYSFSFYFSLFPKRYNTPVLLLIFSSAHLLIYSSTEPLRYNLFSTFCIQLTQYRTWGQKRPQTIKIADFNSFFGLILFTIPTLFTD